MGWFDEQIKQRREQDTSVFEQSFRDAANAVMGQRFSFDEEQATDVIGQVLRYFHIKIPRAPDGKMDAAARLEELCRETGLLFRPVKLEPGWRNNAYGPFVARLRDGGELVAVTPRGYQRYVFFDPARKKTVRVSRAEEKLFEEDALCFYRPLPQKKLNIAELMRFAASSWSVGDMLMIVAAMAASTAVGLLLPKLNYFLFNNVIQSKSISLLLSTVLFTACVMLSQILIQTISGFFTVRTSTKLSLTMDSATMMRVLSLPTGFFRQYSTGEISQRMAYVTQICTTLMNAVFSTGLTGVFSLAYISQIFVFAPALVVPSLVVVCVNLAFSLLSALRQMKLSKRQMELGAKNTGMALAMINGVQKIRLSGAEKRMFARWAARFSEETRITYNPPLLLKLNTAISMLITMGGQFLMYALAIRSHVAVADYYAFQTAYASVSGAISALLGVALLVANVKPTLEMIRPILEAVPEMNGGSRPVGRLSGAIELNQVSFRYEESMPDIIDNFSLKIHAGQYVAIVGRTGCGKSTLVRLLLGFEKPRKGAIYYDGKDLETVDKSSLRRMIGTVMQDDKLFMGDIYSNIVICAPRLTLDEAWEAAETAGIADDIRNMPMGMNTMITDGSGGISGGQRQRLAIARAIAPKPSILIFDEATSALDNVTQKQVSEALDSLHCTRIVIAHRLSTIRHCDRILVMDKGRIIEDGTYEELIEKKGYFADLVARQRIDAAEKEENG